MAKAEKAPTGPRSIMLRRRKDGTLTIKGAWPVEQSLPVSLIGRELATGVAKLTLTIATENDPVTYNVTGFGVHEGSADAEGKPKPNYTEWLCKRVEG